MLPRATFPLSMFVNLIGRYINHCRNFGCDSFLLLYFKL